MIYNLIRFIFFLLYFLKYLFISKKNQLPYFYENTLKILNIKNNIINYHNVNLNDGPFIIISNHYNFTDTAIIYSLNLPLKTIGKYNLFKEINLDLSEKTIYNIADKIDAIPYVKNNKDSGMHVKKRILINYFINNYSILIYGEGTTRKDGKPLDFKHGIFKLCAANNLKVLPVTIKYDKNIGLHTKEKFNYDNVGDTNCNLYIHPVQQNKDWMKLKENVFNYVTSI